jgi:hypothetical protein
MLKEPYTTHINRPTDTKAADVASAAAAAPGVSNATVSKARGANPLAPEPVTGHEFAGARQIKGGRR